MQVDVLTPPHAQIGRGRGCTESNLLSHLIEYVVEDETGSGGGANYGIVMNHDEVGRPVWELVNNAKHANHLLRKRCTKVVKLGVILLYGKVCLTMNQYSAVASVRRNDTSRDEAPVSWTNPKTASSV